VSTSPFPDSPRSPETAACLGWTPLLNALSQGVILRGADGLCLEANPAASRILGVDREALLGRELSALMVRLRSAEGADLAFGDAPGQMALDTGQPVDRKTIGWVRADGTTLWLEVSAESVSPHVVLVSFADITSRKQGEDDLRRSEAKFSKAFHASPDSVNVNRLSDGVYLEVNEGFSRMTGYSVADCLGQSVLAGGLDIWVNQTDRERMKARLCATGLITGMEAAFRKKDGSVLVGLFSASLMEVDGEPCVLSLTRDISELRAQARQLERMTQLYGALSQVNQAIVWAPKRQALMDRICTALVEHHDGRLELVEWAKARHWSMIDRRAATEAPALGTAAAA